MTEKIKMGKRARRKFFKKSARQLLFSDWVTQILAFLITISVYVGVLHFGTSLGLLSDALTKNVQVSTLLLSVYSVLAIALFLPLAAGLVNFEINAIENGKGNIADVFYAFSSTEELARAYKLFFYVLFRVLVFVFPALVILSFTELFYYDGIFIYTMSLFGYDVVYFLLKALFILLIYAAFTRIASKFPGIYISLIRRDLEISECFFIADVCVGTDKKEMSSLASSFLVLVIVSLFTAGILPVVYTAPYVLISFVMYSKYIYDKEMYTKNTVSMMYSDGENKEINM